jgi:chromosome segregation ATPase
LSQVDTLKRSNTEATNVISGLKTDLAQLEKDKKTLASEIEAKAEDLEILQLEMDKIKDEKEDLLEEMKKAAEMNAN